MTENISHNIKDIQAVIAKTTKKWNRKAGDVTLVAVSKVQPDERIDAALAAGQRTFGENRVQEAYAHWESRRADYPDLRLHLIGPLQSNKAADAVALFDVIETVDRKKIARVLGQEMEKQGRKLPCFIQVNTGSEAQKAGIDPAELQQFYDYCINECGLDIAGLMCIPPIDEPAGIHFAFLKTLADRIGVSALSMGMSADYPPAIAAGATYVRVGSALFGARAT